ncbi:hypothetical protein [Stappia sp.]|uniref:hypothetical protein n=1 Tax=Stappia sp. TaxID=1870903 RepID=UPI000C951BFE|nr:hypothetical protein [Stappia sp.]MAA97780.1 hypothetical protein [Stappia sp.]
MSRLNAFRSALETTFQAALPALRSCEAQFGRFDLDELKRHSIKAPGLRLAVLRAPVIVQADSSYDLDLECAAFAVAEGREETRDADALAVAEAVLAVLGPRQRFGLDSISAPRDMRISPLLTGNLDRRGVSVVAIEWKQRLLNVTAGVFEPGVTIDLRLEVNGEPFDVDGAA